MCSKLAYLVVLVSIIIVLVGSSGADDQFTKDKQECAPQLGVLAPCLPYVSGDNGDKTPTIDCCTALKQVVNASRKCLCLLVKYKDDPSLGLKINTTNALSLPAVCHAPANMSECPALLHLAPNSPEAKMFDDFARRSETSSSSPAASSNSTSSSSTGSSTAVKSDGGMGTRTLKARQPVYVAFLLILWFITF
ncbi:hypothetical protein Ancab_024760 [Ancistrocladus abbreviatus]